MVTPRTVRLPPGYGDRHRRLSTDASVSADFPSAARVVSDHRGTLPRAGMRGCAITSSAAARGTYATPSKSLINM